MRIIKQVEVIEASLKSAVFYYIYLDIFRNWTFRVNLIQPKWNVLLFSLLFKQLFKNHTQQWSATEFLCQWDGWQVSEGLCAMKSKCHSEVRDYTVLLLEYFSEGGVICGGQTHLEWQQLSSTEFGHSAAKKEKNPTVSQSTGDLHFYPVCPSDESNSSPHHIVSGLWPKKTVFIIRWRRDRDVKITVCWEKPWEMQSLLVPHQNCLEPMAIIEAPLMSSLILSPIPQVNGCVCVCFFLSHSVLLLILVDYMYTATVQLS